MLLSFLLSRFGAGLLALIVGVFSYQAWKVHQRNVGKEQIITESKIEAKKINEQVRKDRSTINPDTAASELLKRYGRD